MVKRRLRTTAIDIRIRMWAAETHDLAKALVNSRVMIKYQRYQQDSKENNTLRTRWNDNGGTSQFNLSETLGPK